EPDKFGLCHSCGELIDFDRLDALPPARYCINCQLKEESASLRSESVSVRESTHTHTHTFRFSSSGSIVTKADRASTRSAPASLAATSAAPLTCGPNTTTSGTAAAFSAPTDAGTSSHRVSLSIS